MNRSSLYKLIAFLILFAELIIFFVFFGQIRTLIELAGDDLNNKLLVLLGMAVVLVVVLFIITILTTYQKDSEDKYKRDKLDSLSEDEKNKVFVDDSGNDDLLNVESYLSKIIPKANSKLDLEKYTEKILSNIAKEFDIVQGLFFVKEKETEVFNIAGKYACFGEDDPKSFKTGESLSGQVAKNMKALILEEIPENYVTILSGLGSSTPDHVVIIPIIFENKTIAIIELASFKEFKSNFIDLFEGMASEIAKSVIKY